MGRGLAAELAEWTKVTVLLDFVDMEVGAFHGRFEAPFLEEVNIGFGSATFVMLVGSDVDL